MPREISKIEMRTSIAGIAITANSWHGPRAFVSAIFSSALSFR